MNEGKVRERENTCGIPSIPSHVIRVKLGGHICPGELFSGRGGLFP